MPKRSTKSSAKKTKGSKSGGSLQWESASFKITNASGLHARAAATFVTIAKKFSAEVEVCKDRLCVNGKSILGVLMLGAEKDQVIQVKTKGVQAFEALKQLGELIQGGFDE